MKALSIRQPWAWLIANGIKTVENRAWNTNFRGQFLIHASTTALPKDEEELYIDIVMDLTDKNIDVPLSFQRGGIIGIAEIVDVIKPCNAQCYKSECYWHNPDCYGFLIDNAKPLKFYPLRGKLSFFDTNIELEDFV